jgi:hypothetical protein
MYVIYVYMYVIKTWEVIKSNVFVNKHVFVVFINLAQCTHAKSSMYTYIHTYIHIYIYIYIYIYINIYIIVTAAHTSTSKSKVTVTRTPGACIFV